jgi:hypothetical protein
MSWGHITRHKGGQAARPLCNKCGGRTAQSPYVMLRSLAYVKGNKPCGSIGPGHASTLDRCLGHDTSSPGTL